MNEGKRKRTVREGYVDEAVVDRLVSGLGGVIHECLPTGNEIINAAMRILTLGVHAHLTNGDPSATTPEIIARLKRFEKQLAALIEVAFTQHSGDDEERGGDDGAKD